MPIKIPSGVEVKIEDSQVMVKGPRGTLMQTVPTEMDVRVEDGTVNVARPSDHREHRALHGLTRALIANMVLGVTEGFRKTLAIDGVGYRAEMQGNQLVLFLGYSHPIYRVPPPGVKFETDAKARTITVEGPDKQVVGQVAADLRALRPPEPYKGKGIRYIDERVRRKAGKAGKVG
jgi:large subunit ribosomal protein L6